MMKAIGSRVRLNECTGKTAPEFRACVEDLIDEGAVMLLKEVSQHMDVSRFQHSLNVAYYSFLLARKMGLDARAAARGGLLHDLFYYEWKDVPIGTKHISFHPEEAVRNALTICDLSEKEEDIIRCHMWPLGGRRPKFFESYIVCLADKYCATFEISQFIVGKFKRRGMRRRTG